MCDIESLGRRTVSVHTLLEAVNELGISVTGELQLVRLINV